MWQKALLAAYSIWDIIPIIVQVLFVAESIIILAILVHKHTKRRIPSLVTPSESSSCNTKIYL